MAKGKKTCPGCNKEVGCRIKICECGHEFVKKETKIINEKQIIVEKEVTWSPPFEMPDSKEFKKTTPKVHAKRVLSYGTVKATALYQMYKFSKSNWSHVDWDYVGEELGIK